MNAQELFLDVASGRFVDVRTETTRDSRGRVTAVATTAIPVIKPTFFSDEQRTLKLSVLKVQNNKASAVNPSQDARHRIRLGTPSLKLADGVLPSDNPPVLITALATAVTAQAKQAKAVGGIVTYSPITALFLASVKIVTPTKPQLSVSIVPYNPVTAVITAAIANISTLTRAVPLPLVSPDPEGILGYWPRDKLTVEPLYLSTVLNTPEAATFASSISGGEVNLIQIALPGSGYPSGTYSLSFSSGSASASATALDGKIISVSIVSGGSGYGSAPLVTLFTPSKSIASVDSPTKVSSASIGGELFVKWYNSPVSVGARIELIFPQPTQTLTTVPVTVPCGFMLHLSGDRYKIVIVTAGYGYTSSQRITHAPVAFVNPNSGSPEIIANGGLLFAPQRAFPLSNFIKPFPFNTFGGIVSPVKNVLELVGIYNRDAVRQKYQDIALIAAKREGLAMKLPVQGGDAVVVAGTNNLVRRQFITALSNSYDKSFFVVADKRGFGQRAAVGRVTFGPADETIRVRAVVGAFSGEDYLGIGSSDLATQSKCLEVAGGGFLNATFNFIDGGEEYLQSSQLVDFVPISSLASNTSIELAPDANINISITSSSGFINSLISQTATVSTSNELGGVSYFLSAGGLGYTKGQSAIVPQRPSVTGAVKTISITNIANIQSAYAVQNTQLTIQSPPSGGILASAIFNNSSVGGIPFITITCAGSGYTSAPIISAVTPDGSEAYGYVNVDLTKQGVGYIAGKLYPIGFESPKGFAVVSGFFFGGEVPGVPSISLVGGVGIKIDFAGAGYTTFPTISAPSPDNDFPNGTLTGISLTNTPVGYDIGTEYSLEIKTSPSQGGNAQAKFTRTSETQYAIQLDSLGFGYTTAPTVTAPSPDAPQGIVSIVSTTTLGQGYRAGTYDCIVDSAPTGGRTAAIQFIKESADLGEFVVIDIGQGYVSPPNITVPTPGGNIITGISITCKGSFYETETVTINIIDSSGVGAEFTRPSVVQGKIENIFVINKGDGYSNNPVIEFSLPVPPVLPVLPPNLIQADINITVASANAILSTSTQKDILMEVYETDGTNEQVVAQATVSLAKRVLE